MIRTVDEIAFSVVRSRRRTADIVVERDGSVVIRAPETVSDAMIDEAVRTKASWIHRAIAEWEELNAARRRRHFLQGSSFPYLGRNYRLRLVDPAHAALSLRNGWFELSERVLSQTGESGARKAFRDFYNAHLEPILSERVARAAPKVDVCPGPVAVRELGYHWASCGPSGTLSFNWKLAMAPTTVIDYVVVHELCHLKELNHSPRFWRLVARACPDYAAQRRWLRLHGRELRF